MDAIDLNFYSLVLYQSLLTLVNAVGDQKVCILFECTFKRICKLFGTPTAAENATNIQSLRD